MALLDISQVTQSLITLIRGAFDMSPGWPGNIPTLYPVPPIRIPEDGVGIYLYHITEDPHYKNLPAPGRDQPPVRFTPMGLILYYQLSANSLVTDGTGAFLEQQMMGIAMKGLHDYPEINDHTTVDINGAAVPVFPLILQGSNNRLRIVLQPFPASEAVNFWTAGESPLTLAAYYEVSVVLLEPEESTSRAGRVLTYQVQTFVEGAPRINTSQNILAFVMPGRARPTEVKLRPAQVPPGSRVTFSGTGFTGSQISLQLISPRWPEPALAGAAWAVTPGTDEVITTILETIDLPVAGTTADVLPGIYAAQIKVTRTRTLPNGDIRTSEHLSNHCPFAVSPRIDGVGPIGADNRLVVTGYIFQHAELPAANLRVYIAENLLVRGAAPPNPGAFAVVDATHLQIQLPAGLTSGQVLPLRIFINNIESPPQWIEVP